MAKLNIPLSNVNCEKDIINVLVWSRWLLRMLGIWPLVYSDTSTIEKILATISFASYWTVLGLFGVLTTVYTFTDRSVTAEKMRMLGPLSHVFFSMLKYFLLVARHKNIRQSIQFLSTDWRTVHEGCHREIMIKDAEKGHLLSKFCVVFMYCSGLSYPTIMPFLSQSFNVNEQNVTIRPIAYPGFDIVFDLQLMPIYVFAFFIQCFTVLIMFNITTSVCCLAAMFVAHACGQIDIVITCMNDVFKEKGNHLQFEKCMAIIVQHHVRALRFSASIENSLRDLCLIEIVETTLIMCLVEYSLITEWHNSDSVAIFIYFSILISFIFNIFIFCYIGELLTEQCRKVGYISYKTEWYNLPGKVALDLMLIINMSRNPVQITAGKLISLSFANFGNVLKTSVAYLNLLRTAIDRT